MSHSNIVQNNSKISLSNITQKGKSTGTGTRKTDYDAKKTVIIENVAQSNMVSSTRAIKQNLSNYFPRTRFEESARKSPREEKSSCSYRR